MTARNATTGKVYLVAGTDVRIKIVANRYSDGSVMLNPVAEIEGRGRYPVAQGTQLIEPPAGKRSGFITGAQVRIEKMQLQFDLFKAREPKTKKEPRDGKRK